MDEKTLVEKSLEGDPEAFGILVNNYKRKVFYLAYSMTQNRETADDLAQDIFIKAYRALSRFRFKSQFGTWLYRIAVNHIKDFLRSESRVRVQSFEEHMQDPGSQDDEIVKREMEQDVERKQRIVQEAIRSLPPKYRIILSLRDIQGFSYKEITQMLHLSPGTVDSRLYRARKMLKKKVSFFFSKKGESNEM